MAQSLAIARSIEENEPEINSEFKPEVRCFKPEIELLSQQNVQARGTSCLFVISTNYTGLVRPIKERKKCCRFNGSVKRKLTITGKTVG